MRDSIKQMLKVLLGYFGIIFVLLLFWKISATMLFFILGPLSFVWAWAVLNNKFGRKVADWLTQHYFISSLIPSGRWLYIWKNQSKEEYLRDPKRLKGIAAVWVLFGIFCFVVAILGISNAWRIWAR